MTKIEPYATGKLSKNLYAKKQAVDAKLVVVLDGKMEDRGLELIKPISRCVLKDEVHELILTDEPTARPGSRVNNIAYLGFCAIEQSGVIIQGDEVCLDGKIIGHLAGFDETHMPNHLNIVIQTDHLCTGGELAADIGMAVKFVLPVK